jgi:7-keto-8-aminopelargonate synthetase-like enzyme
LGPTRERTTNHHGLGREVDLTHGTFSKSLASVGDD